MKREYFGMIVIGAAVAILFLGDYFFGYLKLMEYVTRYIVVWVVIVFYLGQYSMRFPQRF